jgi:GTP-sensing pleiotropic transcriptional regulator CodY
LAISKICSTFAATKVVNNKRTALMAQETLNSLIAVIKTLSFQEQEQVIIELQDNIIRHAAKYEPTEEQKARLRAAYQQAQSGEVYSQVEAHRMMDEFEPAEYAMAV